jgi:chitinase
VPLNNDTFANELRKLMNATTGKHYLIAAPECPTPDSQKMISNILFDMVFVQFYSNEQDEDAGEGCNFETWDKRAKFKTTKFFVGLRAGSTAAQNRSYILPESLPNELRKAQAFDSTGCVMLWDAGQAWLNDKDHLKVKEVVREGKA